LDEQIINAFECSFVDLETSLSFVKALEELPPPISNRFAGLPKSFQEEGNTREESLS